MTILFLIIAYLFAFFCIAMWGGSRKAASVQKSALVYSLGLAVYCTSWTFYGNIGLASTSGFQPITFYLGATIGLIVLAPLIQRMVQLKSKYHTTSLADFLSARYRHSRCLAALATIICLVGIVPYLTIQLAPMVSTFNVIAQAPMNGSPVESSNLDVWVVVLMAIFTIIFGVRKLDPTERHTGMMVALAAAGIFKFAALLIASAWITYSCWDLISPVLSLGGQGETATSASFEHIYLPPEPINWFSMMLLGALGIWILPRQFHVGVVECADDRHVYSARWQLSIYLLLLNIFVIPVAIAGQILLPEAPIKDLLLLLLPVELGAIGMANLVFIGGFAAASCMIMVSTMTLSTMTTNHLIVPIIEYFPRLGWARAFILQIRWLSVFLILIVALWYYRLIGNNYLLIEVGTISFIAVLQFAPALIGGMLWRKANFYGAIASIIVGASIWFYTAMLPTLIRSGLLETQILEIGPFGITWLAPEQLFGLELPSLANSLFWSLFANISVFIVFSSLWRGEELEELATCEDFVGGVAPTTSSTNESLNTSVLKPDVEFEPKKIKAEMLLRHYMSEERVKHLIEQACLESNIKEATSHINIVQLSQLSSAVTRQLAGVIGMAAAYYAVRSTHLIDGGEQRRLSFYYAELLSQMQLSPTDMIEKVNFYQEKQKLLEDHANRQQASIAQLKEQVEFRQKAEQALKSLNDHLEKRVSDRTQQLESANEELMATLEQLNNTQQQLVEAEKMASLAGLVAGIAHEINTPAGTILTSASIIKERGAELNQAIQNNTLTKSLLSEFITKLISCNDIELANIERIIQLIDSFKLISLHASSESLTQFTLIDVLAEVKLKAEKELGGRNVELRISVPQQIALNSYPSALMEVILSLVRNSLEHGFQPGSSGLIQIQGYERPEYIQLDYRDNGKGIPQDVLQQLFEPFFTTARGQGKLGLGAHIAYNLVYQKLKGSIQATSEVGKGVHFSIKLPRV